VITKEPKNVWLDGRFREPRQPTAELSVLRGCAGTSEVSIWCGPRPGYSVRLDCRWLVMAGPVVRRTMEKSECPGNLAEALCPTGNTNCRDRYRICGLGMMASGVQTSGDLQREGFLETNVSRMKYSAVLLRTGRDFVRNGQKWRVPVWEA